MVGLGGLVYTIIEQPEKGWSATVLVTLVVGTAALVAFVAYELRRSRPMLDPRLFAGRAFGTGSLSVALQFGAGFGLFVIIFQYLQFTLGYSTLEAGLAVVPQGLGIMVAAVVSDRLARHLGLGITGGLGLAVLAAGFVLLALMTGTTSSYWALLPGLVVVGTGLGLASAAATTSVLSGAPAHAQGSASGVNNASREVSGAVGIAAMGSVLNSTYSANVDVRGLPDGAAQRAIDGVSGALQTAGGLGDRGAELAESAQNAFVDGFHTALWLGAVAIALTAVVLFLIGPRAGQADLSAEEDAPSAPAARAAATTLTPPDRPIGSGHAAPPSPSSTTPS